MALGNLILQKFRLESDYFINKPNFNVPLQLVFEIPAGQEVTFREYNIAKVEVCGQIPKFYASVRNWIREVGKDLPKFTDIVSSRARMQGCQERALYRLEQRVQLARPILSH